MMEAKMFHFSVDSKYVDDYVLEELAESGIVLDDVFREQVMEDIQKNFQKHGLTAEDACYVLNDMTSECFFSAKDHTPANVEEAFPIIKKFFFFPPLCIWLDGKSYNIFGQYGEINYVNGDNILSSDNPHFSKVIMW
jgi:hypothetical protein